MIIKNVSRENLESALEMVNLRFANNIAFLKLEPVGRRFRVRLKAQNSHGPGGRLAVYPIKARRSPIDITGRNGKPLQDRHVGNCCCWHVHGYYFEELFKVQPYAVIVSKGNTITKYAGNWEDYNAGSSIAEVYASECCHCEE
jgi:hypothetical protein